MSLPTWRDFSLKQYEVSSPSQIVRGRGNFRRILKINRNCELKKGKYKKILILCLYFYYTYLYFPTAPKGLPLNFSASNNEGKLIKVFLK